MDMAAIEKEIGLLDGDRVRFYRDELHGLCVKVDGQDHQGVSVALIFPLTLRTRYIRVKEEESGTEVGIIKEMDELDPSSRALLEDELARAYFIPKIKKIYRIKEEFGITTWEVDTDKGRRVFDVQERHNVRYIGPNHLIIKDADGNRYEIEDYRKLDQGSIALLESEI